MADPLDAKHIASSGTKVVQGATSFIQTTKTKRGRYLSTNYFAVAPKSYAAGWPDGQRCFHEYMRSLVGQSGCAGNFLEILREISVALHERNPKEDPQCRYGAAVGFVREMEKVLVEAANSGAGNPSLQTRKPSPLRNQKSPMPGHLRLAWSAPA